MLDIILDWIPILSFLIVAVSAAISARKYWKSKDKDREKETFDYIDDKFNEYLQICLSKPYLDVFDVPDDNPVELTEAQKKEEKIAFAFLISIFERVYVFYEDNKHNCDADQLVGWTRTISEYFDRKNFQEAWNENSYGWDSDFVYFMDDLYLKTIQAVQLKSLESSGELVDWHKKYIECFVIDANNDDFDQLQEYFYDEGKYKYEYLWILDESGNRVGGILTQQIKQIVVILYIFVDKDKRKHGYGSLALRTLRNKMGSKVAFLAEIEKRNEKKKKWWKENNFYEIDMEYFTPVMNEDYSQEKESRFFNYLFIHFNNQISPIALSEALEIYFKTSFIHDRKRNISNYESVKKNRNCLYEMKDGLKIKH